MKLIIWQPRTYGFLIPGFLSFLALWLETTPLAVPFLSYVKPALFFIVVWYFHFHYPRLLPLWAIFILSIVYDIALGQKVATTAIALWVALLYPRFFKSHFHENYGLEFFARFLFCFLIYRIVQYLLLFQMNTGVADIILLGSQFLVSAIITLVLWRLLYFFDRYLSKL